MTLYFHQGSYPLCLIHSPNFRERSFSKKITFCEAYITKVGENIPCLEKVFYFGFSKCLFEYIYSMH